MINNNNQVFLNIIYWYYNKIIHWLLLNVLDLNYDMNWDYGKITSEKKM